jgi:phosphoribosylformimino-5-aminoimidazole carboxamide ribotide isomerase
MQIIPVIDLKDGLVVRAVGGNRAAYRPIATPLSQTSQAADVIEGYLRLYPFQTIYVADINAIEGTGENKALIAQLTQAFPRLRFWIDAGVRTQAALFESLSSPRVDTVVGTETFSNLSDLPQLANEPQALLSLDFVERKFLGPEDLLAFSESWPRRVIVMTLARVGANMGPDLDAISRVKARAVSREVFAAGGVRDDRDLKALADAGVAGALVASALHNRTLSRKDIRRWQEK